MNIQTKSIVILILLGIVDAAIPLPIIGMICLYIVIKKPSWFIGFIQDIYHLN